MYNKAEDLVTQSVTRKIKSTYVKALDEFEKHFPDIANSKEFNLFRGAIMHHGEDSIRA